MQTTNDSSPGNRKSGSELGRRIAIPVLLVVGALALSIGVMAFYADHQLFNSGRFADRVTSTLSNSDVRASVARQVSNQVVEKVPETLAIRPLIEGATNTIVGQQRFQSLFRGAVFDAHRLMFKGQKDVLALKLANVGVLLIDVVETANPKLAKKIPKSLQTNLVSISDEAEQGFGIDLAQTAGKISFLEWLCLGIALAAFTATFFIARDRRNNVKNLGFAIAGSGFLILILFQGGRWFFDRQFNEGDRDAARVVFNALLGDLRTWSLVLALGGLVLAGAIAALTRPPALEPILQRIWTAVVRPPTRPLYRVIRALSFTAVGILLLADRTAVLRVLLFVLAVGAIYTGVTELLRVTMPAARAVEEKESESEAEATSPGATGVRRHLPVVIVTIIGLAVLSGGALIALASDKKDAPPFEIKACNGSAELCDRPINEVAFASTHNSMSAGNLKGWLFANQNDSIPQQLKAGVRGLLIDTHYGFQTPRGVATDLKGESKSKEKLVDALGIRFVLTAEKLRKRIGYKGGGKKEVFFCHGYCEMGYTKGTALLGQIRDFLIRNPYEVLVLSVEDDVSPRDTEKIFKDSGLLDLVYKEAPRAKWPTLREMIEKNQRVLVMGENNTGSVPWYHQQFDFVQETPYEFHSAGELAKPSSCAPNRGAASNPFFLINNWVETSPAPKPGNAKKVNAYDALLKRVAACQKIRGRFPNLIAVDLYRYGDVVRVANTLNGVNSR